MKRIERLMTIRPVLAALVALLLLLASGCSSGRNCIDGNCRNGKGIRLLPDGRTYSGQFKNGRFHGRGTYTYLDGRRYQGQFLNNMFHGEGTLTFPDGRKYTGGFDSNHFNGTGTYTFPDGSRYEGTFVEDRYTGRGVFTFADGRKYVGEFVDNAFHGHGEYRFPDHSRLRGVFHMNRPVGEAVFFTPDGEEHKGKFVDGAFVPEKAFLDPGVYSDESGALQKVDSLQTRAERLASEQEALRRFEAQLGTEELLRRVKPIPARYARENLRIYEELLRREPENKTYQQKVSYYRKLVERQDR
jgi:hypothetical protein